MIEMNFTDLQKKINFRITEPEDVEYINPIDFWQNILIPMDISLMRSLMLKNKDFLDTEDSIKEKVYAKLAFKNWIKDYQTFLNIPLNENLETLLQTNKKSKQEKLLKGLCLDSNNLIPLYISAWIIMAILLAITLSGI